MTKQIYRYKAYFATRIITALLCLLLAACHSQTAPTMPQAASQTTTDSSSSTPNNLGEVSTLAEIPLAAGEKLQVAATTSMIGDIVAQVGGEHITLFTLMGPGVDPHSYTPTPQDLRTLNDVDLIFINGLHLEEGLEDLLNEAGAPQVSVNAKVDLLANQEDREEHVAETTAGEDEHEHGPNDPHTWQSVANVKQWVTTIAQTLSTVDPANATAYGNGAAAYQAELEVLDQELRAQIATIPAAKRKLVTDHESFNYFARDYGFTIIGALIPSLSSLAGSNAQELAALQDQIKTEGVPAIFVGTTVNPNLAEQIAGDLHIAVVPLYSDALSDSNGPAATYLAFMRYNVEAIVAALGR